MQKFKPTSSGDVPEIIDQSRMTRLSALFDVCTCEQPRIILSHLQYRSSSHTRWGSPHQRDGMMCGVDTQDTSCRFILYRNNTVIRRRFVGDNGREEILGKDSPLYFRQLTGNYDYPLISGTMQSAPEDEENTRHLKASLRDIAFRAQRLIAHDDKSLSVSPFNHVGAAFNILACRGRDRFRELRVSQQPDHLAITALAGTSQETAMPKRILDITPDKLVLFEAGEGNSWIETRLDRQTGHLTLCEASELFAGDHAKETAHLLPAVQWFLRRRLKRQATSLVDSLSLPPRIEGRGRNLFTI